MSSTTTRNVVDNGHKDQLFEYNDSGLGSMPRDLCSIDMMDSPVDCHQDSDQMTVNQTVTHSKQEDSGCGCPETFQGGHLTSLTSGLLNLNLNAREKTDCDNNGPCFPDRQRMEILERHEAAMRRGGKTELNSLLCENDSGNFSITTASIVATDIEEDEPASHEEQDELTKSAVRHDTVDSHAVQGGSDTFIVSAEQRVTLYQGDADGDNWLHLSIIHGRLDLAMALITLAPDYIWLSYSNLLRQTPLHLAVLTGQDRLVRSLVCAGANVDAQDLRGDTPLHIACRLGHLQTVKSLLTPVRYKENHQDNMWKVPCQRLPQDLGVQNSEGQTPLHIAVIAGHMDVVQMLLKAGADPNAGDAKSGRTALHLAAEKGRVELVQLLACCRDVDLHRQNYAGLTAAQLALGRNLDCIAHFLQPDSDDVSDAESDMTMVGSDSDGEWWDEGDVGME